MILDTQTHDKTRKLTIKFDTPVLTSEFKGLQSR